MQIRCSPSFGIGMNAMPVSVRGMSCGVPLMPRPGV
jgi:hypothetical protein